jgi:hypothetical protein
MSQEKRTPNNKHCSSLTAESDFQSENSRFLELAQDRVGRDPTVKKVTGGCGDEEELPCVIWTMGVGISYTTVVEHQFPVHPHCLVI